MTNTRTRSYTVRQTIPEGSLVTVIETVHRRIPVAGDWNRVVIKPGDEIKVVRYTNAGFNGITARVLTPAGYVTLSAGLLVEL